MSDKFIASKTSCRHNDFCRGRCYTRMEFNVLRGINIPIKSTKNHPVNIHQSILFISAYEADSFHWCMFAIVTLLLFTRPFHWVETEGHRISRLPGHGVENMISWWALLTFLESGDFSPFSFSARIVASSHLATSSFTHFSFVACSGYTVFWFVGC